MLAASVSRSSRSPRNRRCSSALTADNAERPRVSQPPNGDLVQLTPAQRLALAALRSAGVIDAGLATTLETVARALILVALAAVGLNVRIEDLRSVGPRPLLIGLGAALAIGACTILAIVTFGLANGLVV